jgi:hypothetical protein
MKKLILIAAGVLATAGLLTLVGVPGVWADAAREEGAAPAPNAEFWEHMNKMRNIMHFAQVTGKPVEKGVRVEVIGAQPELIEDIKEEFGGARHALKSPYPNTEVSPQMLENGVALTFTSDSPETVQRLQDEGTGLFYGLLRNNMHELMAGQGGFQGPCQGRGFGPAMMGPGKGYGPGSGRGQGWGRGPGYGPWRSRLGSWPRHVGLRSGLRAPGHGRITVPTI